MPPQINYYHFAQVDCTHLLNFLKRMEKPEIEPEEKPHESNGDRLKLSRDLKAQFVCTNIARSEIGVQYRIYLPILNTNEKIATSPDIKTQTHYVEKGNV